MKSPHKYIHRALEAKLKELFNHFPVVVITGARQVGKSTLLEKTFSELQRVVFDPIVDVESARADPDLFLGNRRPPIILDEIQYAPELVPAIKRLLEKDRSPGQYLITGSQQWGVMKLLAESLAGRAVFLDLEGFSLTEAAETTSSTSWIAAWLENPLALTEGIKTPSTLPFTLNEQLWRGFLPEAQFVPRELIADFHSAYQRTYIERDVRQLTDVTDLNLFSRFFRLCAALSAKEINHSEMGRELGITPQTAARWLDILKATFQWFEIPAYSGNTIKRISSKPKGYITDTGLACFALAISSPESIVSHPLWGFLFETAVVCELRKQCRLLSTSPNFYHWRSHGGAEVDLIIEWNGSFYPMEVKANSRPSKSDIRGLNSFRNTYPHLKINKALVVAPAASMYQLDENTFVMPWNAQIGDTTSCLQP